jgi:hypothetical protein
MRLHLAQRLVVIVAVVALGLVGTPTTANAAAIDISLSGSSPYAVGTSITVTPTGTYSALGGECDYLMILQQDYPTWLAGSVDQIHESVAANVDGSCPSWTFTLPNLNTMVATQSLPTWISVSLSTASPSGAGVASPNHWFSYPLSGSTPTPASNLPVLFWQLTPTKSTLGQTVSITMLPVGYPVGWPSVPSDGFYMCGFNTNGSSSFGNCAATAGSMTASFTQPGNGVEIRSWGNHASGTVGTPSLDLIGAMDPPVTDGSASSPAPLAVSSAPVAPIAVTLPSVAPVDAAPAAPLSPDQGPPFALLLVLAVLLALAVVAARRRSVGRALTSGR